MNAARLKPGKKFPLLLYERFFSMVQWPSLLIAIGAGALWWFAPPLPLLASRENWLALAGGLSALLFLGAFAARFFSYVQCQPGYLLIRTPLFRVAVSYSRIQYVRSVIVKDLFPSAQQKWNQRQSIEPFLSSTVVAVNLKGYPLDERLLKLWLNNFMFTRDTPGFLFIVRDWMSLSREIDAYKEQWLARKRDSARPERGLTSLVR